MDIPTSSDALDVDFHPSPSSNLLVTGLISGKVQLIDFQQANGGRADGERGSQKGKGKQYEKRWTVRPSNKSCRGVAFAKEGDSIFSLAKDGSMYRLDTQTGSVVSTWGQAHEAAPSRILSVEQNLIATGDDDGVVSLWDPRKPSSSSSSTAVRTYDHHFDWITSMLWCQHLAPPRKSKLTKEEEEKRRAREEKKRKRKEKRGKGAVKEDEEEEEGEEDSTTDIGAATQRERLVVTSGDGTLSVIDIRTGKAGVQVSEDQEDELLSIASVKRDSKLVVGTQLGILSLWAPTKGLLDHVDRIPGHPSSVDAMCTLDDDTILTGSSDGLVRVVQILPHQLLGIVADHGGMPVERLARRENWLASIGHGPEIKLTDLAPLLEEGESDEEDGGGDAELAAQPLGSTKLFAAVGDDDASDEEEDEDGEAQLHAYSEDEEKEGEDSEEESERENQPVLKKARGATILRPITQTQEDVSASAFFADL